MSTPFFHRTFALSLLGWLGAGVALSGTIAACSDSLHLDPVTTAGTGGGSTGPGSGGGGNAPVACRSNADCAYPNAVCDEIAQLCVECLVLSDCALKPGTVCSMGQCACPTGTETFCAADAQQAARCVDTQISSSDCGSCGHACFGACVAGKCADAWEPTSTVDAPTPRTRHVAVWDTAGNRMIVWGGNGPGGMQASGGMYDPATNTWTPTSTVNVPAGRQDATAIWDDAHKLMIVWGGRIGGTPTDTGGIFDPATNTWVHVSSDNAPSARYGHTAVWTGTRMIVWGGTDGTSFLSDGAAFDPVMNTWSSPITGGLTGRHSHTAVWTGSTMVVWGGYGTDGITNGIYLGDGAVYDLAQWVGLSASSAPSARRSHTAVWTGMSMVLFGGIGAMGQAMGDGAKYAGGSWIPLNNPAPEPREAHTAVWLASSNEMIIWGGIAGGTRLDSGYRLNNLDWSGPLPTAPEARAHHTAVAYDSKMIIWGGDTAAGNTNTGAIFDAAAP